MIDYLFVFYLVLKRAKSVRIFANIPYNNIYNYNNNNNNISSSSSTNNKSLISVITVRWDWDGRAEIGGRGAVVRGYWRKLGGRGRRQGLGKIGGV